MGRTVCWFSLHWVGLLTMGLSDEPGHSQQASTVWTVDSGTMVGYSFMCEPVARLFIFNERSKP